jgi:predicted ATPase
MVNFDLSLLGPAQVRLGKEYIEVKPRKALALLVYLAVTAERQARDSLATLLWPNSDQRRARHALRSRLSELNLTLGGNWIEADRESVGLRAGYGLDVSEFQRLLAVPAADLQSLTAATDLYRNDFLTGFTLPDCPEFDEWQFFQSESLLRTFASSLERLVGLLSEQADYEKAIPYARRNLALDPLHEPAQRQLMLLYARAGQHAAALRQYEICRRTLKEELGISPSAETTALYNDIRDRRATDRDSESRWRHNLPTQTTTFIGREAELADIKRLLVDEPGCRLLNLIGAGGIGKTRLALAAATQTLAEFPDGTYFISLAPISEIEDIVPAIAAALRFTFHGSSDPEEQLLEHLSQKQLLLVVDNFEHLLDGAGLLSDILSHATKVALLVTSRERLNLKEEWFYEVQGLSFPTVTSKTSEVLETSEVSTAYSAVELFTQRARQIATDFTPSAEERADIGRICQLVEGMPLGLELAAPWIRALSCREIAAEIERSLYFLTTTLRNVPERHRSLSVVFEQTWERLSQTEQTVLMQLAVFRGGCTREAAEQVTGATLPVLSSLVDKALLRRTILGRYMLHELIRQFAEVQLQSDLDAAKQAQQRHADYFVAFLEALTIGVKGREQKEALAKIKADIDNVRLVWRQVVANRDAEAIDRTAECLFIFYLYSSGHYEGQLAFQQAVDAFTDVSDFPVERRSLIGFLLTGQGYFLARTRDPEAGKALIEQAVALLRQVEQGDRRREAFALLWLGWAIYLQGKNSEAQEYVTASLPLFVAADDHLGEAWSLLLWSNCTEEGNPLEAEAALKRALTVCQKSGDKNNLGYTLHNLVAIHTFLGRYAEAQQENDQAISLFKELDNILGLGYAMRNQGQLDNVLGKHRHAVKALQQAEAYFNNVRTERNIINAQIELGTALRLQGDYDRAERLYGQLLTATKAAKDQRNIALCLTGLGCLAYDRRELRRAERFLSEALDIWQQQNLEARMGDVLRYLGMVVAATGKYRHAKARHYFWQALGLATKHKISPIALDVCVGMAQLLLAGTGNPKQAVELLTLARQHEASTFETKERARHHLAELADQLAPEAVRGAQGQDLWTTVQELLAELAGDEGRIEH